MKPRNKGALAEYRFISTALSLDLRVLTPAVDGYAYDVVVDNGSRFYKIQVKYASKDKRVNNQFGAMTQRTTSSIRGDYQNYTANEVDFFALYIYYIDTFYIIPYDAVKGKSITVNTHNAKNKYTEYKNNWKQLLR